MASLLTTKRSLLLLLVVVVLGVAVLPAHGSGSIERGQRAAARFGWKQQQAVSGDSSVQLRFALRQPREGIQELENALYDVSTPGNKNYGRHLTLKDIRSLVAARPEHVEIARQWVHANLPGAQQQVGPTSDYLFVSTTADAVKMAFQVPLFQFVRPQAMRRSHSSKQRMASGKLTTLVRSTTVVDVPSALVDAVETIHGLDDFPPPFEVTGLGSRSQAHNSSATDATSINVTPDVIYSQYNLKFTDPRLHAASATQSVAEFEQAYFYTKDLAKFQTTYKLPSQPIERIVGKNDPNSGYLGECSLDVEYITASGRDAETWMWSIGPFDLVQWAQQVLNTTGAPLVHSISWGSQENGFDSSTLDRTNTEFMKLGATGNSVLVASGDGGTGSTGFFSCGVFAPAFPATSPSVTAVGGTSLPTATSAEVGWSDSGGGFSDHFGRPEYQVQAVNGYLGKPNLPAQQYWNKSGRAIPDVSALATNFQVLISGFIGPLSGTSCATPTFAAQITLINGARIHAGMSPLGFLNPALYKLGRVGQDITSGNNKVSACPAGFPAVEGYDAITGLGTPDFSFLLDNLGPSSASTME